MATSTKSSSCFWLSTAKLSSVKKTLRPCSITGIPKATAKFQSASPSSLCLVIKMEASQRRSVQSSMHALKVSHSCHSLTSMTASVKTTFSSSAEISLESTRSHLLRTRCITMVKVLATTSRPLSLRITTKITFSKTRGNIWKRAQ